MKINRTGLSLALAASLALVALGASAELQNVIVNGTYGMKDDLRTVDVSSVSKDDSGQPVEYLRMRTGGLGNQSCSARIENVALPAVPKPKSFQTMGRVFLSFYVGRPEGDQGDMDIAVTVSGHEPFVAPYRVYTGLVTEPGWRPVLIDLRPWAGQTLDIVFQAGWLDGEATEIILGLPRLVSSHGPCYAGSGGMQSGTYQHGMPRVSRNGYAFGVDGTRMENGPLALSRFDAIKPSTLNLQSDVQGYVARLTPGIHWLPLQLPVGAKPEADMRCAEGLVEQGPIDVIPNFMAGDEVRLKGIVKRLDPPLSISMAPQLFGATASVTTAR